MWIYHSVCVCGGGHKQLYVEGKTYATAQVTRTVVPKA